ncbi:L-ribulose-5-phosphate 4-epimerase [Enterococcus gilvus]|uniref:L-ribulose-5-phosphate 4-epimerase n=1 Tax=Enterococcus gilvus ATCC BAA-350 TaxID=1158614 RepID=R2V7I0_9ENTE|nr:L-ribulose-5-phosphate 4-epimerase [Enterococcus gilvus]EOI53700.1 L-ribulose-5-phosphate 4-epimerase [Enterococcus gilvus ATCC BAA-350]EOW81025.1 L-ribulose-5-phosphate 4-epimerase [Enterococcus gilvus ATCC BAA-350]MBS5821560.1 class II aldolase/adducin family protein [Enterococcus gilvus]OJG41955.1 L-ribulose-5-phosphate 4-epimerase [Enterococcus gilvus]
MLEQLKETVCKENKALPKNGLVLWTSGNVSAKDPETEYVVIKPSGIHFDDLTPDDMIVVDLAGTVIEGRLSPSVDTESHLYVYNHCPEVYGITHTHSPYATAFSIAGESLPIYTTTSAAVFGKTIPLSKIAAVGEKAIGAEIVRCYQETNCPAILLKNHGVFTVGKSATHSLKNAVILEETTQSVFYARSLNPELQPLDDEYISEVFDFYQNNYGQK